MANTTAESRAAGHYDVLVDAGQARSSLCSARTAAEFEHAVLACGA